MEEKENKTKEADLEEPLLLENLEEMEIPIDKLKNMSISEVFRLGKIPKEIIKEILKVGNKSFEKIIKEKYNESNEREEKMKEQSKEKLYQNYKNLLQVFKEYIDLDEKYLSLICIWIIGATNHNKFISYPYLFFNAMKGSGKTRLLKLITYFCSGSMLNSLKEAVLFRTDDMLAIDEFEAVSRRGSEDLRELLNSAYKQGTKVKRMRKQKTPEGEKQVVEEFDVYRPIVMANISGLENVLEDRSLTIILERSNNKLIINKAEMWEYCTVPIHIKHFLQNECSLCGVVTPVDVYVGWNEFLTLSTLNTHTYTHTYTTQITTALNNTNFDTITALNDFYRKIDESGIGGRNFELTFPLLFTAYQIEKEIFNITLETLRELVEEKKQEDSTESKDISLIEFISMQVEETNKWISIRELLEKFKRYLQENDEWINNRWLGRALKRLVLIKEKRRLNSGVYVILNVEKAQEKIGMFK